MKYLALIALLTASCGVSTVEPPFPTDPGKDGAVTIPMDATLVLIELDSQVIYIHGGKVYSHKPMNVYFDYQKWTEKEFQEKYLASE